MPLLYSVRVSAVLKMSVNFRVVAILLVCLAQTAYSGCTHYLTGKRGQIWSVTDVTSYHCEWDINADAGSIIQAVVPVTAGSSSGSIDMELLKEREIHRSRLQGGQILGEGAFGHVVKATLTHPEKDDVTVAVKKLKGPLQLVLEYAEHGSLLHLLWTLRAESKLNRTVLVNKRHIFENMMVEVCSGLEHLASRRLVHRDIAARNILICGKGTAKIADFGLARDMYAVGYHRQDGGNDLLPLKWMAPECLKNEARFTHKSDVWSFGVLLWEVAQLGRTPYPGMEGADRIYDALQNHFRLPRPQLCTEERYQLMLQCWKFNEKTRPDATTVKQQLEADPNNPETTAYKRASNSAQSRKTSEGWAGGSLQAPDVVGGRPNE
uniref:Protein kinase domain-containing protein n=1 Tax=Branchiostoma floridae TaxID=7739 RepID=C3ZRH7_BRAFL|eukprot:XP_002588766.1 hypothetical protein BRAFLDRAFT_89807 [Branchiostoma floridae]